MRLILSALLLASAPALTAAATPSTWYVNGLNGDDALYTGLTPTDPLKTLGKVFGKVHAGDTVYLDGPTQFPITPDGTGSDPDLNTFNTIPAGINLICRDWNSVISGHLVLGPNADGMVVKDCRLQARIAQPLINAGATNNHRFTNVQFYGGAYGFYGTGSNHDFEHCRFQGNSFGIWLAGAGHVILNNTFYNGSYGVYLTGAMAAIKYNLFDRVGWAVYNDPGNTTVFGQYQVDSNWIIYTNPYYNLPSGPNNVSGNIDVDFADYFALAPDAVVINAVYEPVSGRYITPGCCDVATKLGSGGSLPFANNWRTWSNGAWTPITTSSTPIKTDGNVIYLADGYNNGVVRSSEVTGVVGAKLKSFHIERATTTNVAPGFRSDIDGDPSTFTRELAIRAVGCGHGFDDPATAPSPQFLGVYNGQRLEPPLGGVDPAAAPCWQTQLRFDRQLP